MLDKRRKTYNKVGKNWKLERERDRKRDFEVAKLYLFPSFFMATQRRNTGGKRGRGPTHRSRP